MTTITPLGQHLAENLQISWRESPFRRMTISVDDDRLVLRRQGLFSERVEHLNVAAVDHVFDSLRSVGWGSCLGTLLFGGGGLFVWFVAVRAAKPSDFWFAAFWATVFTLVGAAFLNAAWRKTGRFFCLFNGYQGTPLLLIRDCAATAAGMPRLSALLKEKQRALRDEQTAAGSLAGQLRQLGELHKSGVLSDAEFASAKQKLIGRSETIGFARKDT